MGRLVTLLTSACSVVAGLLIGGFGSHAVTLAGLFGGFLAFIVTLWVVVIKARAWFHHDSMPMNPLFPFGDLRPGAQIVWSRVSHLLLCTALFSFSVVIGVLVRVNA
jgi:hypothetical protein